MRYLLVVYISFFNLTGLAGVNVWTSQGPCGGTVLTLAVHPADPGVMYAGTANGGVFKSTSGGTSWAPAGNISGSRQINALAIASSGADRIYAGTAGGVWVSTNGGAAWSGASTGLTCATVQSLAIDPADPSIIYAGTWGGGIFKSTDQGNHWSGVNTSLTNLFVYAVVHDPHAASTVYAGTWGGGVFRSGSGGSAWAPVNNGLTSLNVLTLAVDGASPAALYAGTWDGGVFTSTSGGNLWTGVNNGLTDATVYSLATGRINPAELYAGTPSGCFRSTNGGAGWIGVNSGLPSNPVYALAVHPSTADRVFAGTWMSGVYRSTNAGAGWTPSNAGLNNVTVRAVLATVTDPPAAFAGTWGGGVFRSTPGGSWEEASSGLLDYYVAALAADPANPSVMYAGTAGGVYKSTNGGNAWVAASEGLSSSHVRALVIDAAAPSTIYAGIWLGGVFKSTDGGGHWFPVNTGLASTEVFALAIDPVVTSTVYAATWGGGVFRTFTGGGSWEAVNTGLACKYVYSVAAEPVAVYAGTRTAGVFKSTDGGTVWIAANNGMTNPEVQALAIDPAVPARVYAGTAGGGIFRSTNRGGSWSTFNSGLLNHHILALTADAAAQVTTHAGTSGNGVYSFTRVTCLGPAITGQPSGTAIPFGQTATLSVTATGTAPLHYQWYQGVKGDTAHPSGNDAPVFTTPALTVTTSYWVKVSNACGTADSETATITVPPCTAPSITGQPSGRTILSGQSAALSVTAAGTAPLQYQWYKGQKGDTSVPAGAGTPGYTTPALTVTTAYWVRVTNACGTADSEAATITVTVCTGPSITVQPAGAAVQTGGTATLTVTATGTPPLHYQWYQGLKGDTAMPAGGDASTCTVPQLNQRTAFWVRVSNSCGISDSNSTWVECYHRTGNFTLGGYLGTGTVNPARAVHIRGGNAVFRMDRSVNTAAFMIVRTDEQGEILKTFLAGVNTTGPQSGCFLVSDLGRSTGGSAANRLTIGNAGDSIFSGQVHARGFVTTSSRTWKTNIRPLTGALALLRGMQGYRFSWKETGEETGGFLAGEVALFAPEWAESPKREWLADDRDAALELAGSGWPGGIAAGLSGGPEKMLHRPGTGDGFLFGAGQPSTGISYARLTAILLESIKTQERQIEELKRKRTRLQSLLDELRQLRATPPDR